MTTCDVQASGAIELYFYGELEGMERRSIADHVESCGPWPAARAHMARLRAARTGAA